MVDIRKALQSASAGGTIRLLEEPAIDKVIAQMIDYNNPLRQNIPRRKGTGFAYRFHRRTAAGETYYHWIGETTTTTGTGFIDQSSYTLVEVPYATLFAKGRVTRVLQAESRGYINVLAQEIEDRSIDFRNAEDYAMVSGSSSGTMGGRCEAGKGPSGLAELLDMYDSASQVIWSGTDGGTSLTLEMVDELIDKCKGMPDMLIMSKKTRRILQGLMQVNQRWVNVVEVKGGFRLPTYNGIPIFVSSNISDAETCLVSPSDSITTTCSSIYAVDKENFFVAERTPVTVKPLAKTTSQYDEFEIYCDECFVLKNPLYCARLKGVMP